MEERPVSRAFSTAGLTLGTLVGSTMRNGIPSWLAYTIGAYSVSGLRFTVVRLSSTPRIEAFILFSNAALSLSSTRSNHRILVTSGRRKVVACVKLIQMLWFRNGTLGMRPTVTNDAFRLFSTTALRICTKKTTSQVAAAAANSCQQQHHTTAHQFSRLTNTQIQNTYLCTCRNSRTRKHMKIILGFLS